MYPVFQRLAVAASCIVFWILATEYTANPAFKPWLLAVLALLACVEKLCSIMNFISVEKDWVCFHRYIHCSYLRLQVVVIAGNGEEALQGPYI